MAQVTGVQVQQTRWSHAAAHLPHGQALREAPETIATPRSTGRLSH